MLVQVHVPQSTSRDSIRTKGSTRFSGRAHGGGVQCQEFVTRYKRLGKSLSARTEYSTELVTPTYTLFSPIPHSLRFGQRANLAAGSFIARGIGGLAMTPLLVGRVSPPIRPLIAAIRAYGDLDGRAAPVPAGPTASPRLGRGRGARKDQGRRTYCSLTRATQTPPLREVPLFLFLLISVSLSAGRCGGE